MNQEEVKTATFKKLSFVDLIPTLLNAEPFFAAFSRYIEKMPSNTVPTMGVCVTDDGFFKLIYNPTFVETLIPEFKIPEGELSPEQQEQVKQYEEIAAKMNGMSEEQKNKYRLGVLKHEFYHIILEHITLRKPSEEWHKVWNVAADLSINTFIPDEIPEWGCIPGGKNYEKYPEKQPAEWYFDKLKKDGAQGQKTVYFSIDDHGNWTGEMTDGDGNPIGGNIDPQLKKIAQDRLKEMLKRATKEAASQGWGNMPEHIQRHIMDYIRPPSLDWQGILRSFVRKSQRCNKTSTVRRLDRRMPWIWPGKKVKRQSKIAISIDQSGSVGDNLLVKFFSELNNLAEFAEFTVVPFDHEVVKDKIFTWKKGTHYKPERVACGGTDFNAPTIWVNDEAIFDAHIVLTDGYAPKPIPSKVQRMWVLPMNQQSNPTFETNEIRVFVPEDNEE